MTLVCVQPDAWGGYHLWDHTAVGARQAAHAAGASDANLYERGFCRVWRLDETQVGRALVNGARPVMWPPYGLRFEHTGAPG